MTEPTLEQRLDAAIERTRRVVAANADILAMHECLDALQAGTLQPVVRLTAEQLEEMDEENPGAEISRCPWKW